MCTLKQTFTIFVNGNVITNEVGSKADVLAVLKTVKAMPSVAQVEELELAA